MLKIILAFLLTCLGSWAATGGGGGGAPNVVTISPGANLATYNWQNDTAYQLGEGTYAVTPSILVSNVTAGNAFTGITIAGKTNIMIQGVYGQTILDGSSGPGEVLFITNCSAITLRGLTIRGYTNHHVNPLPLNSLLFAGVQYAMTDRLIVEDCIIERHMDHGIADSASGLLSGATVTRMSTNAIIRRNYFTDIGGFRTNTAGGISRDGTAIVPTGGIIEDNTIVGVLRGIEPYTDANGVNRPFRVAVRRNTIINAVNAAIPTYNTNVWNSVFENNRIYNENTFLYHGSNYGVTFAWGSDGILISGGRGNAVRGNTVEGSFLNAVAVLNSTSKADEFSVTDNYCIDINNRGNQGYGFYLGDPINTAASASSVRRLEFARNTAIRCQDAGFALWAGRDVEFYDNRAINCNLVNAGTTFGAQYIFGYPGFSTAPLTNINVRNNTAYKDVAGPSFSFYISDNISSMRFENNSSHTNEVTYSSFVSGSMTNRSGFNVQVVGPAAQYSATIDLPSIGVAAQFTTNFTATGLTTNSVVESLRIPAVFYSSGNTTNVVYNAWCSNDTVYIKFSNNDAVTAADAPSVRMIATTRLAQIIGQ